jgi:hypothetical protein
MRGLPSNARHSIVSVVELNGPKLLLAAGSLSAAFRLRPTETVLAQIVLGDEHDLAALPDRR